MPILAIKNEIEVELTHACNWKCPYCAINTHNLPVITHDQALKKINSIKNNSIVTLSGGEPGLIKKEYIQQYISILKSKNCTLYLNTNGTFLFKYDDLIHEFKEIVYHCSEDLQLDYPLYENTLVDNIRYMLIVNDDNIERLIPFLNKYQHIKFDIVAATYNEPNRKPTLSNKNKYFILKSCYKQLTHDSIKRLFKEKDFDSMVFI